MSDFVLSCKVYEGRIEKVHGYQGKPTSEKGHGFWETLKTIIKELEGLKGALNKIKKMNKF